MANIREHFDTPDRDRPEVRVAESERERRRREVIALRSRIQAEERRLKLDREMLAAIERAEE